MIEIRLSTGETLTYDGRYYRCEHKEKGIFIFAGAALVAFLNFEVVDVFLIKEVVK